MTILSNIFINVNAIHPPPEGRGFLAKSKVMAVFVPCDLTEEEKLDPSLLTSVIELQSID